MIEKGQFPYKISCDNTLIFMPEPNPKTIRYQNGKWKEIKIFDRVKTETEKYKLVRKLFQEAKWPAILTH